MKLEAATPDEQKIGWTYSYSMLDKLNEECTLQHGYRPGMEEIEAILKLLAHHGIISLNVKITGGLTAESKKTNE